MIKRRACLLSWLGPETYTLLQNLWWWKYFAEWLEALTDKFSFHFKEVVYVQAARYAFYDCKM